MPVTPTYPGVYIEELPSPVKTIVGVSTSITAFIGRAVKGPVDEAKMIHSFADYDRIYGGLWESSNLSYAVYQYFQNGGHDAIIMRSVTGNATPSTFSIGSLKLQAANPGKWGNNLEITVDITDVEDTDNPANPDPTLFKLKVELVQYADPNTNKKIQFRGRSVLASEVYAKLSTKPDNSSRFVRKVLEKRSDLIRVQEGEDIPEEQPPAQDTPFTADPDSGTDGDPLTRNEIYDPNNPKVGLGLLDKVDLFNMLCIPPFNDNPVPKETYEDALAFFCIPKRAMLIVDSPSDWGTKDQAVKGIEGFMEKNANAAVWFPQIIAPDPKDREGKTRPFVPCGAIAGVIARTDTERGVWKSPAGIEASLIGVSDLTVKLANEENGDLNPLGVNCMRIFQEIGIVNWGARTLRGADKLTDQWKYLSVRRTALYIEESLYRGTQWVVFEPNDERLWGQIRLNVGAFMHDLFRKGAFQGTDPSKAYLVKCDSETTTQYDIDRGIVNILVGFAPLKPAEFVILQIKQLTQQEATA